MAWNYRKRVKVAPGVYMNISKGGISTSVGVRGASMTFGKNGTYMNTGIPGSGYYNRRRISGGSHRAPQSPQLPPVKQSDDKATGGCLMLTLSLVCMALAFIYDYPLLWVGALAFGCGGLIMAGASNKKNASRANSDPAKGQQAYIDEARTALGSASHPTQRRILESFVNSCDTIDEIDDQEKIIEKLSQKPESNADKIQEHQLALDQLKARLDRQQYDVDAELEPAQLEAYGKMCEAFEAMQECDKIWLITAQAPSSEHKSSATTTVTRREGCVYSGVFNYLKSQFDIPAFEVPGGTLYLYPQFAILAQRPGLFDFEPYTEVTVTSSIQKFNEEDGVPADSEVDSYTWLYVNKNGDPDRRFADNKKVPVAIYGKLIIKYGNTSYTFHFSNYAKTKAFALAMAAYKECLGVKTEEDGDRLDYLQRRTEELKKRTEELQGRSSQPASKLDFNLALSSATKLYKELVTLSKDKQVLAALDTYPTQLDPLNQIELRNIDNRLGVLTAMGAIKCFEKLGHTDISSDEGLTLSLFLMQILNPEQSAVWTNETEMRSSRGLELRRLAYDVFKKSVQITFDETKILIIEVLRSQGVDEAKVNRLAVLLYRFARVIAEADENVDGAEKEWLVNLLSFTKPAAPAEPAQGADKKAADSESKPAAAMPSSQGDALKELNGLIGLGSVKTEIQNVYNLIKIQKVRQAKGLKASSISYHCVFTGNPGTGKTTVARLVAQIYKDLGILSRGHLVETDRSGLVAEYVGQTAVKTNKIIDSALDGVLFIDEAYSLVQGGGNDYGMEAIATLLKRMEDNRDRLVVILAGYSGEMKEFIDANPGLQSRFNRYIHFEDYGVDDLVAIFGFNCKKYDYQLTDEAQARLREVISAAVAAKDKNFGNARFVRNLFEKTLEAQARRLATVTDLSESLLTEIQAGDIPASV